MTARVTMARRNVIVAQPISATPIAASGPAVLRHLPRRTREIPPRSRLLGCVGKPVRPRVVGDTDQVGRAGHSKRPLVPPDPQGLLGVVTCPGLLLVSTMDIV